MSAAAQRRRAPQARPDTDRTRADRPRLRVVDPAAMQAANRRRRAVYVAAGALFAAMFVSALAQAQLVSGQQEINEMRNQVSAAESERARLEREIHVASAPQAIVERATELGMVRAEDPQYFPAVRATSAP